MANKWRTFSYSARQDQLHRVRRMVFLALGFFLFYLLLTTFGFFNKALNTSSMEPGLRAGDRMIFGSRLIFRLLPDEAARFQLNRGDIVLVDMAEGETPLLRSLLDPVVRFFTAQQLDITGRTERQFVKRIIGLPGDQISMTGFVIRVKPADSPYILTEYELSRRPYDLTIPQGPALWDESLPFSGTLGSIVLGEQECFVLSDDRSNTNDSRTWGVLPLDCIVGTALFRYWPLNRIGLP
ncbi:MAG: signal peptidase I [Treponema sp.]|jgi:signal peptidase I|nr:signal peptidase I [Treponema sp.]